MHLLVTSSPASRKTQRILPDELPKRPAPYFPHTFSLYPEKVYWKNHKLTQTLWNTHNNSKENEAIQPVVPTLSFLTLSLAQHVAVEWPTPSNLPSTFPVFKLKVLCPGTPLLPGNWNSRSSYTKQ